MKRNWESQVREICKNAVNYSGTSCEIDIKLEGEEKDCVRIKFTPKMKDSLVMFHISELESIENIVFGRLKFINVIDGVLEISFYK